DRRGSISRAVEQRRKLGIVGREPQHRRAPAHGHGSARADRAEHELAHRAAVLRARVAVGLETVGENTVGRRTPGGGGGDDAVEQADCGLDSRCGSNRAAPRMFPMFALSMGWARCTAMLRSDGAPLARAAAMIWSSRPFAACTRAAGVMPELRGRLQR